MPSSRMSRQEESRAADDDPDVIRISWTPRPAGTSPETGRIPGGAEATKAGITTPEPRSELVPQGIGPDLVLAEHLHRDLERRCGCGGRPTRADILMPPIGDQPGEPGEFERFASIYYRMVMFADATGLEVKLVYYPPYHSKYNPIETAGASWECRERDLTEQHRDPRSMGWDDDLERDSSDRQADRDDLPQTRSDRQGRL